jgi:hypothetical protein
MGAGGLSSEGRERRQNTFLTGAGGRGYSPVDEKLATTWLFPILVAQTFPALPARLASAPANSFSSTGLTM